MNNNRRRNFRPRQQKNNFRRRTGSMNSGSSSSLNNNGNMSFNRNGSMNNIHNVEKTMLKFQQLAKDAQSNGDPVLSQNYLQHADHYLRRYNELNERKEISIERTKSEEKPLTQENTPEEEKHIEANRSHQELEEGLLGGSEVAKGVPRDPQETPKTTRRASKTPQR